MKNDQLRRSIRSDSLASYALRITIPLAIIILLVIWITENQLLQSTIETQLRSHIEEVGQRETVKISTKLADLRQFAHSLASNDLIINALIDAGGRDKYLPIFFRSLSAPVADQASVTLLDYTGRGIAKNKRDNAMPPVSPDMIAEGAFFIDSFRLLIVEPILVSGQAEGAIVLEYPASTFDKLFSRPNPPHSLYITGYNGLIIYSTNSELAGVDELSSDAPADGWLRTDSPVAKSNLAVYVGSSLKDALEPMDDIRSMRITGLIILLSVLIALVLLSVFIVSRPLKQLTSAISTIESVDDLDRPLCTKGPAEITEIAATFNQMTKWLKSTTVSRNYMDSIFESIIEGIVTIDSHGVITTFNSSATKLFGYHSDEVVGSNVSILMQESDRKEHDHYVHNAKMRAARIIGQNRELEGRRKDGSLFPLELSVTPIHEGSQHGFVGTIRDITERKEIEERLEQRSLELKQINQELEHMALTDGLTGLGNRNLFNDRLETLVSTNKRNHNQFALLMMDLNKFKAVNDTHGHEAGDAVLKEVGVRLKATGRDVDSFFRLGGDEFAGLITTGISEEGIGILCARLIQALKTPVTFNALSLDVGVSIGFVIFPDHGDEGEALLHLADTAMYEAKRGKLGFTSATFPAKKSSNTA